MGGKVFQQQRKEIGVEIKLLRPKQTNSLPYYATPGAAGVDLIAAIEEPIRLKPGEQALIGTGIAIHIQDPNCAAFLFPRSGLGSKGLVLGNGTGVIDADYQGEVKVCALNRLPKEDGFTFLSAVLTINPGDRIAQMVFMPVMFGRFLSVEKFSTETERGEGGFGSTGVA